MQKMKTGKNTANAPVKLTAGGKLPTGPRMAGGAKSNVKGYCAKP